MAAAFEAMALPLKRLPRSPIRYACPCSGCSCRPAPADFPPAASPLMEMPASSLSFHVKELHRAGLLSQSPGLVARSFTWPHSETMNASQAYLPETCGGGKPCPLYRSALSPL